MSAEAIRPTLPANADYEANLLAEFATDGELSARGQPGRCAVTGAESQPWWTVSLDYSYRVRSVLLWFGDEELNVLDATITVHVGEYTTCITFLIEQLKLCAGDSPDNAESGNAVCGMLPSGFETNVSNPCASYHCSVAEVLCETELVGRYVMVVLSTSNTSETRALSLCEVQVFGGECDERYVRVLHYAMLVVQPFLALLR